MQYIKGQKTKRSQFDDENFTAQISGVYNKTCPPRSA